MKRQVFKPISPKLRLECSSPVMHMLAKKYNLSIKRSKQLLGKELDLPVLTSSRDHSYDFESLSWRSYHRRYEWQNVDLAIYAL